MQVWIKGEEDVNPVKLRAGVNFDVADLLIEASKNGEFCHLVNNAINFNILFNKEILPQNSVVSDHESTPNNPFIITKAKRPEPNCMLIVLECFIVNFIFRQQPSKEISSET